MPTLALDRIDHDEATALYDLQSHIAAAFELSDGELHYVCESALNGRGSCRDNGDLECRPCSLNGLLVEAFELVSELTGL